MISPSDHLSLFSVHAGVLTAAFGGFFLVSSIVGLIGLNRKSSGMVGLYTLLMVLSLGALVYLCYRLFVEVSTSMAHAQYKPTMVARVVEPAVNMM